jgi:4-amino-4-deoxy-L-arabinose transferase-like glycosyltransferase
MTSLDLDRLTAGWRGPALAAFVALLASLPGLIAMPPLDRTEARFAQATAQMLESGDWTESRFQDRATHEFSPAVHWLQGLSVATASSQEARAIWAYRIPSLLGAMLAAAGCVIGARRFWGDRRGVAAGITLASSLILSTEGFIAKSDALLCACVTLAMVALSRLYEQGREDERLEKRWKLVFWAALAASVLVKGAVGPVIVGLTLATLAIWDRKSAWMARLGWAWGLILILAAVGPWAVAVTVVSDGDFWRGASAQMWRALGGADRYVGAPGYHLAASPLLFFPGSLLLIAGAWAGWKQRRETGPRFALAWLLPAWLMFELTPGKLPHYVLPLYPALAWLVAAALSQNLSRVALWGGIVLSAIAALAWSAISIWLLGQYGDASDQIYVSIAVVCLLGAVFIGGWFMRNREVITALMITCALGVLAHAALSVGLAPHLKGLWPMRNLVRSLDRVGLDPRQGLVPGPVAIAGFSAPSAVFLLGTETELGDAEDAARAVAQGRPAAVEERARDAFNQALARHGVKAVPAGTVKGYDYTRGQPISLTVYRPGPPPGRRPEESAP